MTKANNISLNESKTELVLFRTRGKMIIRNMNFRIRREKIKLLQKKP